jgi:hypothetical protein
VELVKDFEERNSFFEAIQAPYTIMDHRTTRQGTRYKVSFGDNRNPRWITEDAIDPHAVKAYTPQVHVTTPTDRHGVDEPFESRKPRPGEKLERPILYIARQTTGGEPSYESTEREAYHQYILLLLLTLSPVTLSPLERARVHTYAPVSKLSTLRMLLATAAQRNWKIDHMDVKSACLNPAIDKDNVYMTLPKGIEEIEPSLSGSKSIVRLRKALYGLKQAPKLWYDSINQFLLSLDFTQSTADPNLYIKDGALLLL